MLERQCYTKCTQSILFDMRLYCNPRSFRSIPPPLYSECSKCLALLETDWLIRLRFSLPAVQSYRIGELEELERPIAHRGASPDPSFSKILFSSGQIVSARHIISVSILNDLGSLSALEGERGKSRAVEKKERRKKKKTCE